MTLMTPGNLVHGTGAWPPAVVEVATAVPAFIGYTEQAEREGRSLTRVPTRIASMADYTRLFGGAPTPRFALSTQPPDPPACATDAPGQHSVIRHRQRDYHLTRAPGQAGGRFLLHAALQHFYANGGEACYVVSVGDYQDPAGLSAGNDTEGLIGGLAPLADEPEPTLVLVPDAVLLDQAACLRVQRQMVRHCGETMRNRIALLDIWGGQLAMDDPGYRCIDRFRDDIGSTGLDFAAAYTPWLHTTRVAAQELDLASLVGDGAPPLPAQALADGELLRALREAACEQLNLMPPSAAVAGLYARVDRSRGVWKAPANLAVAQVRRPAVAITAADQDGLNVNPQGKSINAIREFIGEGSLVWGARTLDGNSLDWRYVNVRRTLIMIEQSCRLAVRALAAEANGDATWAAVKAMIGAFLLGIWQRGGLAGAAPEDAFSVHAGLGETMTPDDLRHGILRVTLLVALSRPAEFIEISFEQAMPRP